jgi:hypothetical protein
LVEETYGISEASMIEVTTYRRNINKMQGNLILMEFL